MHPHIRRQHHTHRRSGARPAFIGFVAASDFADALDEGVIDGRWFEHLQSCQHAADVAAQAGCTVMTTPLPLYDWVDYCEVEDVAVDDTREMAFWLAEIVERDMFDEALDGNVIVEAIIEMLDSGSQEELLERVLADLETDPSWDLSDFYDGSDDAWGRVTPLVAALEEKLVSGVELFLADVRELFETVTEGCVLQLEVHVAADHPAAILDDDEDDDDETAEAYERRDEVAQVHYQSWVALIDDEPLGYGCPDALRAAVLWAFAAGGSASLMSRTFNLADTTTNNVVQVRSWVFSDGTVAAF